jgi:phosphoadenosine phosphosulfate reductase
VALVSSFGAEAAVLLHLVASVDAATPVLFVDTEKLFGETLRYRDQLVARLGLTDVRTLTPDPARVAELDAKGILWSRDKDLCCRIRKVEPLEAGLQPFAAWISGRKRFQAASRAAIPLVEADGARLKINPLAAWTPEQLAVYTIENDLPAHPLVADGYPSIGCMPCTDRVRPGEDARAGRWRGSEKTECGIHFGLGRGDATVERDCA